MNRLERIKEAHDRYIDRTKSHAITDLTYIKNSVRASESIEMIEIEEKQLRKKRTYFANSSKQTGEFLGITTAMVMKIEKRAIRKLRSIMKTNIKDW